MDALKELYATSDVARDILQNSDYFTSLGKAINEYAWNSIDYCKQNQRVEVKIRARMAGKVKIRQQKEIHWNGAIIEETKNGGGMSRQDLENFFKMHGETMARKLGRMVRGRYGTGKSAAFGIGKALIVDTVKNGKRNVVRLEKDKLHPGMNKIPIESLLIDQPTDKLDGTTIIIDRLNVKRINKEHVKRYLIRSLNRTLNNHDVYFEGERLEHRPPPSEKTFVFNTPDESKNLLGDCKLSLMESKSNLDDEDQGVAILARGFMVEVMSLQNAGAWSPRLFGEVDCPLLDPETPDEIPAFDNTRSRLNRDNERVKALTEWINSSVRQVVSQLDREAKAQIDAQNQKNLQKIAKDLEQLLNEDFSRVLNELDDETNIGGSGSIPAKTSGLNGKPTFETSLDGFLNAAPDPQGDATVLTSTAEGGSAATPEPSEPVPSTLGDEGKPVQEVRGGESRKASRGGFKVNYSHQGPDAYRAEFIRDKMEIRLNLDFPELSIFSEMTEDFRFKSLSAEIAVSEYAVAAVQYMCEKGMVDISTEPALALAEVRRVLNRLGMSLRGLLQKWLDNGAVKTPNA